MSERMLQLRNGCELIVSPTQLDTFRRCPRMWRHRYIDLRERAATAPARDGGKSFDAAMNCRYTRMGSAAPDAACADTMQRVCADAFAGLDIPLDEWRTPARYADAIRLYNEHYGEESFDVLGVQLPFEVALGEVPVRYDFWSQLEGRMVPPVSERVHVRLHGILDLLIRDRASGLVLVCDTKTASQWGAAQQAAYDNNAQMKAYAWSVPQMRAQLGEAAGPPWATLPDAVHGCMVNAVVLRKPYARESSANAANALARTEFHRFIVTYSAERLEEWRQDALAWVEQALGCVARDHFPQNEAHCGHHFGRRCDYIDCCTAPKEQRAMILASDLYQDYKRGPLAVEAKDESL